LTIALHKTYYQLPLKELRRRARAHDPLAQLLYRAASYDVSLNALLWLIIVLSAAGSFVLLIQLLPGWLAFGLVVSLLWIGFVWLPGTTLKRSRQWLAKFTPFVVWLLHYLHPLLSWLERLVHNHYPVNVHTGLYDKDDLLDLLAWQKNQPDNRISPGELDIAAHAIGFGDKLVAECMVPRRAVLAVNVSDSVGPVLMDELHASGHSRFPVYEGKREHIVGTLYLRDLVDAAPLASGGGKVRALMKPKVFYVHEDFTLYQVLQAFLRTKHHLFVVVNSFEEVVGIITIEDVLEQIIGTPIMDEFDTYDDLRAVAAKAAKTEHEAHEKADTEPPEVIE
jgi:CBS domain containing-hemolysin-like protein